MAFQAPTDGPEVAYEFYAPFAHVPGRWEWCRIRSATHGVFDVFVLLGPSVSAPATVYARDPRGLAFLRERFPECLAFRARTLRIREARHGRVVRGSLRAREGPLRAARMALAAPRDAQPEQVPYGGEGKPLWGSARWTCWGVDLVLRGEARGWLRGPRGSRERVRADAIVTLGSFGRIAPRSQGEAGAGSRENS